ncbi:phosphoglycerate kinase [Candidatus Atelocyanobacterium thalassae]|uniref:Phosphoglycerate kinase n=1 Tax=cyanobacterium endosymbiont of Braarudosphaera bigelowii TaxID=1285375 RepID=A0ABM7UC32_9CHRO|nr:phosphoglycerate kinase [Candidatus Atelocyanobacterium thalassa]BDA39481.1 phosphoglycerate kinase [cyanobacterium endosymbiont of Braarudosphaera bigelowii]
MSKKTLAYLSEQEITGKRVLVRTDFNVPMKDQLIVDDTRIRAALPTIEKLISQKAKVILCSHMGRPQGKIIDSMSLAPIAIHLSKLLKKKVIMCDECIDGSVKKIIDNLKDGEIALLENLRFHKEEEANNFEFAQKLASYADIYVNDAFASVHRSHASIEGITHHVKFNVAGYLIEKELKYLNDYVNNPQRPLAAIIGGSKVSNKIDIIEALLDKCDKLLLGGGMIFTFYKARGLNVGKSLVEDEKLDLARSLEIKAKAKGVELIIPNDIVIADSFSPDAIFETTSINNIKDNWIGLDIGHQSIKAFRETLKNCKTVIWNGPMGVCEFDQFAIGTQKIAHTLVELTEKGTTTIIGGGDSVAAINKIGVANKVSHISTGGGASLALLKDKMLPGIAALDDM